MTRTSIHDFYEKLLEEASFDLHERYSQLLAGLQWKVDEEDASLISYIIEDMRERSSCYSPVTLREWGVFRAWKTYAKQLGKQQGVQFEFEEASFHEWNEGDAVIFRLLQQMIQFIISEEGPEFIRVSVEADTLLLFYEKEEMTRKEKNFSKEFADSARVSVSVRKEGTTKIWVLKGKGEN
ncbi:hypothetical protein [Salimicrobium flavidum]|uniref:Two-component system, NarL family, sensor histidine kinase NreB n=1 Tax=Salimicrobium flavidum TaxID=570947 RepID=A0A1N7IT22_9BACI|nr:hypothetical protein [Salimicrobium flavidum]SIS40177.1 two-component system, NarL family, sensor histidine kinase NreB [Salimicrobium flavidum]